MPNTDFLKFIQIPVTQVSVEGLVRKLTEENLQLCQAIDEMTNTLAMQKELIEQLKDEIAKLKGQKPRANIRPGNLEGQNRKPNWHARIGLYKGQIIVFRGSRQNPLNYLKGQFVRFTSRK